MTETQRHFYLSTDRKLVGIFGTSAPKPMPVLGFYNGADGVPEWVPAGFDIRAGRDLPRCTSVVEDPERYDALSVQIAARIVGASKDGADDLARRLREGGEPVRASVNRLTHELMSIATVLRDGAAR